MNTSMKKPIKSLPEEVKSLSTKSAQIRYLYSEGWEKGDIARSMGIRYQHVRNVLITPLTGNKQ